MDDEEVGSSSQITTSRLNDSGENQVVTIDNKEKSEKQESSKTFKVLLWTEFFRNQWTVNYPELNCSYRNCEATNDRNQLKASDAVLFHWRNLKPSDLPPIHKQGQKWVIFNHEPPINTYPVSSVRSFLEDIDWTLTYRSDSDIYAPYGLIYSCDRQWVDRNLFEGKTRTASWIVSNCMTQSKRNVIVDGLKKFIDIDIFGRCGPKENEAKCSRTGNTCWVNIEKNYKFYLAFENSVSLTFNFFS